MFDLTQAEYHLNRHDDYMKQEHTGLALRHFRMAQLHFAVHKNNPKNFRHPTGNPASRVFIHK